MDALIELVAASFVRHGIVCPSADSSLVTEPAASPAALPEHNCRKRLQGDPAP
jgi:hypothetical protein